MSIVIERNKCELWVSDSVWVSLLCVNTQAFILFIAIQVFCSFIKFLVTKS